jgi:hypothetical protein
VDVAEFLKSLEDAKGVPRPPGRIVFWRDDADTEDTDVDEIDAWVKDNGGRIRRERAPASQGMQRGEMVRQPGGVALFYEVPREALWPKK